MPTKKVEEALMKATLDYIKEVGALKFKKLSFFFSSFKRSS